MNITYRKQPATAFRSLPLRVLRRDHLRRWRSHRPVVGA